MAFANKIAHTHNNKDTRQIHSKEAIAIAQDRAKYK